MLVIATLFRPKGSSIYIRKYLVKSSRDKAYSCEGLTIVIVSLLNTRNIYIPPKISIPFMCNPTQEQGTSTGTGEKPITQTAPSCKHAPTGIVRERSEKWDLKRNTLPKTCTCTVLGSVFGRRTTEETKEQCLFKKQNDRRGRLPCAIDAGVNEAYPLRCLSLSNLNIIAHCDFKVGLVSRAFKASGSGQFHTPPPPF